MKVRPLERDVYNYIKKRKVVTCVELMHNFGMGDNVLISRFLPNCATGLGISEELWDALYELRERGSIFEIACGIELHNVLTSDIPDLDIEIAVFKRQYKYGYSGLKWLPTVFCSETGLINIFNLYFYDLKVTNKSLYNKTLTEINNMLQGEVKGKLMLMIYISDLLAGQFSNRWRVKLSKIKKLNGLE